MDKNLVVVIPQKSYFQCCSYCRNIFVCPMPCIAWDRIENHLDKSSVRCPTSVDKIVMPYMDRSSPNLEHSFSVP